MIDKVDLSESLNVKGQVKLELFDAKTKQVVNKVEGENFIAKSVREQLFKMAMANLFWRGKESGGSSRDLPALFDRVLLTDFDGAEAPNTEWSVRGNWIGIADTTKVGTATAIEGVYNKDESFTQGNQVRVVIDFPTSSANGVINSVYFLGDFPDSSFHSYLPKFAEGEDTSLLTGPVSMTKYRDRYYAFDDRNRVLLVFDENQKLIKSTDKIPYSPHSLVAYNDYIYIRGNRTVHRSSISDLENWAQIFSDLKGGNYNSLIFNSELTQFVSIYVQSQEFYMDIFDKDFKLLSSKKLKNNLWKPQSYIGSIGYHLGGSDYLIGARASRSEPEIHVSGDSVYNHSIMPQTDYNYTNRRVGVFKNAILHPDWTLAPKQGFSSRFKLPSSVVKTELNTMKLTYDFILPEIVSLED